MESTASSADACGLAESRSTRGGIAWADHCRLRNHALTWGVVSAVIFFGVYQGLLGWLSSFQYAFSEFLRLWYWIAPLILGFGVQMGLYLYARGAARSAGPHASGIMASGGASTVSMGACCAHHLADVLPMMGLAGTGLFLSAYQELFLLVGVVSNAMGTLYLLSVIGRHRLAPAEGSVLSALPALPWRGVLIGGSAVSGLVLAVGLWLSLI